MIGRTFNVSDETGKAVGRVAGTSKTVSSAGLTISGIVNVVTRSSSHAGNCRIDYRACLAMRNYCRAPLATEAIESEIKASCIIAVTSAYAEGEGGSAGIAGGVCAIRAMRYK